MALPVAGRRVIKAVFAKSEKNIKIPALHFPRFMVLSYSRLGH